MTYTKVDGADIDPAPGPHLAASPFDKRIGEALGVRAFGFYEVELPAGSSTVPHDHQDDRAEDVYAVIRGSGVVVIDGHEVPLSPGQYIAVTPESRREVRAGDQGFAFIAVCAAPMDDCRPDRPDLPPSA